MKNFGYYCIVTVLILLLVLLFGSLVMRGVFECTKVEVKTFTVGCEVSQMAYAEETTNRSNSKPVFKMGVRNDDFATTFDISGEQFARYAIGDIVEIEIIEYEYINGTTSQEYKLIR